MSILEISFPQDFDEKYDKLCDMLSDIVKEKQALLDKQINGNNNIGVIKQSEELKIEISAGKLGSYSDGTIRFGNQILDMRNQIKDLCRLFMGNQNRLLTFEDIRDDLIRADKRQSIPNKTISKYVSELRKLLEVHFKKDVITSQKDEGFYFKL